tara:strand:- start:267 stop:587 length:321 start_codon:yes stop_codon:yes gene_type:complete
MLLKTLKEYWEWVVGLILVFAAYTLGKKQTGIDSEDLEEMLENSEKEKENLKAIQQKHLANKKLIESETKRQIIELEEWRKSSQKEIEENKKDPDDVFKNLGIEKK